MNDIKTVMSWLEGLTQDDWREYHSDSEVQNIAREALRVLKKAEFTPKPDKLLDVYGKYYAKIVRCKDCKFYPNGEGTTKWVPCREIITTKNWFCADGKRCHANEGGEVG